MRGADTFTDSLFTLRRLDDFVPAQYQLRPIREMVNQALKEIEPLLSGMYAADVKGGSSQHCPRDTPACHDKGYDAREFIDTLTELNVVPHVAQNTSHRRSAVPDDNADSDSYAISQQKRKLIEQGFGWAKFIGPIRQVMVRGLDKVDQLFVLTMAAYNLTRMRTLGAIRLLGAT